MYVFQSTLYDTAWDANLAVAAEFMTAGGLNSIDDMISGFEGSTDSELARYCADVWEMDGAEWFEIEELEEAFAHYRADPESLLDD
jgi:hypothetical protein